MVEDIRFSSGGREYHWRGGFGAVIKSYERGVRVGDVRMIEGDTYYAFMVQPRWLRRSEISWSLKPISAERVREIRRALFGADAY